jgi:hypothetical protein
MFFFILPIVVLGTSLVNGLNNTVCTPTSTQKNTSTILVNLRREMQNAGIGIYLVFSDDEHGSEYTQPYDKRRDWITGFRGSAGIAIVSLRTAALWTDSRYFTQAEEELDCTNWLLMRDGQQGVPSILGWLITEANQTILVRLSIDIFRFATRDCDNEHFFSHTTVSLFVCFLTFILSKGLTALYSTCRFLKDFCGYLFFYLFLLATRQYNCVYFFGMVVISQYCIKSNRKTTSTC